MMSNKKIEVLERALKREKLARKEAERILESKANDLYNLTKQLKESNSTLESLLAKKDLELKGVFKNIVDAYCVMDMYGNVLQMNDATYELLGFNEKQDSINLLEFLHKDDVPFTYKAFQKLLENGEFKDFIVKINTHDGITKKLHINASLIFNDNGKPVAVQGIARDITKEQELKSNILSSENRMKILIENLDSGVLLVNEMGNIILTNKKFCDLLSISKSPELMVGKSCICTLEHSESLFKDPLEFRKSIDRILENKDEVTSDELEMIDGKFLNRDFIPIFNDGIYKGHLWTFKDVTSKKEIERNRKESEDRLKTLVLNLDSGIFLADEHEIALLTNKKLCELFYIDTDPELLKGVDFSNAAEEFKNLFIEPDAFAKRFNEIIRNREEVVGEEVRMSDGKILERNYTPIYKGGQFKGHLWSFNDVTLQRTYEKNLEAQKQKYSNIIANMNLGLVEVDAESKILMANQSFATLIGYNMEELIGKSAIPFLVADYNQDAAITISQGTMQGNSGSFNIDVKNKNGDIRTWLISSAPNYDEKGDVTGSIGVILDITEETQNKKLLIEQKRQLDLIVENSPVGIALFKKKGERALMVNKSLCDMFGYSEEELMNTVIKAPTHPDDVAVSEAYSQQLINGEIDRYSIEKRYLNRDGSILWARTNLNAVRDEFNEIKYQIAIIEDITSEREKKLMLETLNNVAKSILGKVELTDIAREMTRNISNYLGSSDCVMYLVDYENKNLKQIAAYGKKLGKDKEIINSFEIPFEAGIVGHVAKTGKPIIVGDTSKDPRYLIDDEMRFSEITVPIINDGEVIGVIDSEHAEKHFFTEEHLLTLENIARLVSLQLKNAINYNERTRAENRNVILLRELEKSNDELQEYAHIVSHDLKSPLRSIFALVSWLKEDNVAKLDNASLENIALIESTLEKMEQLITDILNYSSVTASSIVSEMVDLNEVVEDIHQILFFPKHITLKVKNTLPTLKGDKVRFQQLFQNLIGNAIRFIDKKKGVITIDVKEQKTQYQFSVKDNGVGIEEYYHDTIFKIFHSLTDNKESTGIGLSIVKKIVELYNGEIWLKSTVGKGTTFYFTIKKDA